MPKKYDLQNVRAFTNIALILVLIGLGTAAAIFEQVAANANLFTVAFTG